jgi:uncharacterized membrane protein YqjE
MEIIEEPTRNKEISVIDWLITFLITAIPVIGFIMLIVWAFGENTSSTKSNWAKASLVVIFLVVGFYGLLFALFGAFWVFGDF